MLTLHDSTLETFEDALTILFGYPNPTVTDDQPCNLPIRPKIYTNRLAGAEFDGV